MPNGSFEKNLLKIFLSVSLVAHIYIIVNGVNLQKLFDKKAVDDEIVIETDLVFSSGLGEELSLSDAKVSKNLAVQKQTLPQLTKNMSAAEDNEQPPEKVPGKDDMVAPEEAAKKLAEAERNKNEKEKKKLEEEKQLAEKEKEKEKELRKKKLAERKKNAKEKLLQKVSQEEALKRLAREKLRKEKKLAAQDQTLKKKLAARGKELAERLSEGEQSLKLNEEEKNYISRLRGRIRDNFNPPALYASKMRNKVVKISFKLDAGGNISAVESITGSGDDIVDGILKEQAQKSQDVGKPPRNLVGRTIQLNFQF